MGTHVQLAAGSACRRTQVMPGLSCPPGFSWLMEELLQRGPPIPPFLLPHPVMASLRGPSSLLSSHAGNISALH